MFYANIDRQLQINLCMNVSSSFWGGYSCVDGRYFFHGRWLECCEATFHLSAQQRSTVLLHIIWQWTRLPSLICMLLSYLC